MKKRSKILALLMVAIMAMSVFVGCGKSTSQKKSGTLHIGVAQLGYGTLWLENLIDAYEDKTGNKVELTIEIGQKGNSKFNDVIESGATDLDLVFNESSKVRENIYGGSFTMDGVTYDCLYADISDVYNTKVDGESKTIAEKMDADSLKKVEYDGKYYTMQWSMGTLGFVRNVDVWNKLGLTDEDIPVTTEEMFAVSQSIIDNDKNTDGIVPFIYCDSDEYYTMVTPIWFAQYEGKENTNKFLQGKDFDGERTEYLYDYQGLEEALKVTGELLTRNGFQHERAKSQEFTMMQGLFLKGQAAFCPNGSWLELEMGNYDEAKIDFVRTPVVSAIINNGPDLDQDGERDPMTTITTDEKLSEVIRAIDAGKSEVAGVSEEDFAIVKEARSISYLNTGAGSVGYIPAYSDNVEGAKEFLKFMYSDEGLNIYYKTLKGATLPFTPTTGWDDSVKLTSFRRDVNKAFEENTVFSYQTTGKIFILGGVDAYWRNGTSSIVSNFKKGKQAGKTVEETATNIIGSNRQYLSNNWTNLKDFR